MILKVGTTQRYSEECHVPYAFYPLLSFTPCLSRQVTSLTSFWLICIYYSFSFCTVCIF